jgi:hypothetical protein
VHTAPPLLPTKDFNAAEEFMGGGTILAMSVTAASSSQHPRPI